MGLYFEFEPSDSWDIQEGREPSVSISVVKSVLGDIMLKCCFIHKGVGHCDAYR